MKGGDSLDARLNNEKEVAEREERNKGERRRRRSCTGGKEGRTL